MDIGGKFAGTYSGAMNMMGNLGGALAPTAIGHILKITNRNWAVAFDISAGAYFLAALCWLFIDPVTPLAAAKTTPPPRTRDVDLSASQDGE
jgi:nitrate/nitrite transporter NarK